MSEPGQQGVQGPATPHGCGRPLAACVFDQHRQRCGGATCRGPRARRGPPAHWPEATRRWDAPTRAAKVERSGRVRPAAPAPAAAARTPRHRIASARARRWRKPSAPGAAPHAAARRTTIASASRTSEAPQHPSIGWLCDTMAATQRREPRSRMWRRPENETRPTRGPPSLPAPLSVRARRRRRRARPVGRDTRRTVWWRWPACRRLASTRPPRREAQVIFGAAEAPASVLQIANHADATAAEIVLRAFAV